MQEHNQVDLYITIADDKQNASVEKELTNYKIEEVVAVTLRQVGITQQVMLTLLVTDDAGIQEMNKQYREQNKPTDVLSFPLLEKPLVTAPEDQLWPPQEQEEAENATPFVTPPEMITNLGDIVMSWPTLVRQAAEAGHSTAYELLYLLSHGILHLVGYDDQTEAGYQAMVQLQKAVLQVVGQEP